MERHDESLSTRDLAGTAAEPTPEPAPELEHDPTTSAVAEEPAEADSLLPEGEEGDFRRRWEEIQTRFVDDPRQAVEDADELVAGVMQRIADGFAGARDDPCTVGARAATDPGRAGPRRRVHELGDRLGRGYSWTSGTTARRRS